MVDIQFCETPVLRTAYVEGGPREGQPVFLLHGWPDDATTYDGVAPALQAAGWRTFTPWLRGFGETRFLDVSTMRSGEIAAMTQDVLDMADALGFDRFAVVGHDWGARIAAVLAATHPGRITHCATLSVAWQPGILETPPLEQTRAYWYQWFMATARGHAFVHAHGKEFAHKMWETWGPPGWFDEATFDGVAESFANPDWADVTVHSYRVRWQEADPDPRYAALAAAQVAARTVDVPVLMLQGGEDRVTLPFTTEGKERHYTAGYQRRVLPGVGHFPTREAPEQVAALLVDFLSRAVKPAYRPS